MYKWVRDGPRGQAPFVAGPDGGLVAGPMAELRHAAAHWVPLWTQVEDAVLVDDPFLARLDGLPRMGDPGPLEAEAVRTALRSLPLGKAPGLDQWASEAHWSRPGAFPKGRERRATRTASASKGPGSPILGRPSNLARNGSSTRTASSTWV